MSFLRHSSGTVVPPLLVVVHRQIQEVSKHARPGAEANVRDPRIRAPRSMRTKERTVLQIHRVWADVSDKGT